MFSNFCQLDLENKTCVTLANLLSFNKSWIENLTFLDLAMVIKSACVVILQVNTYGESSAMSMRHKSSLNM